MSNIIMTLEEGESYIAKIQAVTGVGGPLAKAALDAVKLMLVVLQNAMSGAVSADTATKELDMLTASLKDDDDAADTALDAKFDKAP